MLSPAGLFAPCGGGTPFRRKVTSDHRPQHFFSVRRTYFSVDGIRAWRLTVTIPMSIYSHCIAPLYLLPSPDSFFFIEMLVVWRHVIPAGRSRPAFAALAPADHAPANQRVLADEHQSPGATGRRNFPSTQTLW